ncbi:MAG: sugar ABC transporter ATP-binding protein [Actinobacteria bacterium]|nr:sugar ABC transporter ATP-binding protein [Actinomycetota bacterium]
MSASPLQDAPTTPMVSVRGVTKRYPGVVALDDASVDFGSGEVIGLVGKNGAGKSSLIKVLAGAERPDEGEVLIDGEPLPRNYDARHAHELGLAFVHQELSSFPGLTVAENVALGTRYPRSVGPLVDRRGLRRRVAAVLGELESTIDPAAHIEDLTAVEQRVVMIARALYHEARLLVLDEPSVSLTLEEVGHLHKIVRGLRAQGKSVIFVSHRLGEIISLTDRIVVMQDGSVILEQPTSEATEASLVAAIAGGDPGLRPPAQLPARAEAGAEPVLRVRNLRLEPRVEDISLEVYPGEILGLAGLVGSGRTELARLIFGAERPEAGTIEIDGRVRRLRSPNAAVRAGVALLPEDRRHEGLVLDFSVRENLTLASLAQHRIGRLPVPSRASETRTATETIERLGIRTPGPERAVRRLSGGNQQKVVLGKWLQRRERLLIFDEPTQGIDVGAREDVFASIRELAESGRAVIVISSDFSELVGLCTRVVALREGRVTGALEKESISEEALVRLAYAADE